MFDNLKTNLFFILNTEDGDRKDIKIYVSKFAYLSCNCSSNFNMYKWLNLGPRPFMLTQIKPVSRKLFKKTYLNTNETFYLNINANIARYKDSKCWNSFKITPSLNYKYTMRRFRIPISTGSYEENRFKRNFSYMFKYECRLVNIRRCYKTDTYVTFTRKTVFFYSAILRADSKSRILGSILKRPFNWNAAGLAFKILTGNKKTEIYFFNEEA